MDALILDFDGTLVEPFTARSLAGARAAVARLGCDMPVAILTNQGGPAYRLAGSLRHPSPGQVASNLDRGLRAVGLPPARVARLAVATWPGNAWQGRPAEAHFGAALAEAQIQAALVQLGWAQARVSGSSDWRKPQPGALVWLALQLGVSPVDITLVGDRDTDRSCASGAGCRFQWADDWHAGRQP